MRNIAILSDGFSDYLVLRKFLKCLFEKHRGEVLCDSKFIDLQNLKIEGPLVKYIDKVSRTGDYSYNTKEADDLIKALINTYYACFAKFGRELDAVTNKEIIIINADSEKLINERIGYFQNWAYSIKGILNYSIEHFYEKMASQGHSYEYIPLILPIILFPSSEILVAACVYNLTAENMRQLKPTPDLKTKVYGTYSINEAIETGKFETVLNTYLTADNINEIYKEVPEARILIHSLIA